MTQFGEFSAWDLGLGFKVWRFWGVGVNPIRVNPSIPTHRPCHNLIMLEPQHWMAVLLTTSSGPYNAISPRSLFGTLRSVCVAWPQKSGNSTITLTLPKPETL